MISLAKVLSGKPIEVVKDIFFYQPTLQDIVDMGETSYWGLLNTWTIDRKDMIQEENEKTLELDDYLLWKACVFSSPVFKGALIQSCNVLLKAKVEFYDLSGTIYIGEKSSGVILDETFYLLMKELCHRFIPDSSASDEGSQYQITDNMSERERQMIEKMKASEKKIEQTKNPDKKPEDYLGNRILGLVAVGGYTFEQVYNMTMLQFNMLLQKYVDIQTFELRTSLSPYISSEEGQTNKFWLD
jgi:hypothetical protein